MIGKDVNPEVREQPFVALFAVAADVRNARPPHDITKDYQPFMIASSLSSEFKGSQNPLRTQFGHPNTMESMFNLILLRSLVTDTTMKDYIT